MCRQVTAKSVQSAPVFDLLLFSVPEVLHALQTIEPKKAASPEVFHVVRGKFVLFARLHLLSM